MAGNWLTDVVKAGLVVGGLALVIGNQAELRTTGREVLASVGEFVRPTPEASVPTNSAPVIAEEPAASVEQAPCRSRPVCRPRVTYVIVQPHSCGRVVRSCH